MSLETLSRLFDECLRDAGVFERDAPGGALVEMDRFKKDNSDWLAVAAGIDEELAHNIFPAHRKRAERATLPLRIAGGPAQASLLFVVRPMAFPIEKHSPLTMVTHFAPGDDVPLIEIRTGFLRLWDLSKNEAGLNTFRWEVDARPSLAKPREPWLTNWATIVGCNPAHMPSHIHLNSPAIGPNQDSKERKDDGSAELRIAIGTPNPIALILSVAAWIRAN